MPQIGALEGYLLELEMGVFYFLELEMASSYFLKTRIGPPFQSLFL